MLLGVLVVALVLGVLVSPLSKKVEQLIEPVGSPAPANNQNSNATAAAVQDELEQSSEGRVLYYIPSRMVEGHEVNIPVRISANLVEDLTKGLPAADEATSASIPVYTLMGVRLQGDEGFQIVPPPEQDQFVAKDQFTEWNYRVTPVASGNHVLTLLVGVRLPLPGGHEESRFKPLLERKVTVRVNVRYATMRFLGEHVDLFLTALVFGPSGFGLRMWIEDRKRKTANSAPPAKEKDPTSA
jgi:hypothetical protein